MSFFSMYQDKISFLFFNFMQNHQVIIIMFLFHSCLCIDPPRSLPFLLYELFISMFLPLKKKKKFFVKQDESKVIIICVSWLNENGEKGSEPGSQQIYYLVPILKPRAYLLVGSKAQENKKYKKKLHRSLATIIKFF